jgi:hypothetical protein
VSSDDTTTDRDAYDELCAYSLSHTEPGFVHQHVVDAFAAQHASEATRPIQLTFALVGLYLHVERKFTGWQVQRVHTQLAERTKVFPTFALRAVRGTVGVKDVLAAPPGAARDAAIDAWCASVWAAYGHTRPAIVELLTVANG